MAQVVATDDLESALRRIVAAAAGSVRAPAFVLALDPLPWAATWSRTRSRVSVFPSEGCPGSHQPQ